MWELAPIITKVIIAAIVAIFVIGFLFTFVMVILDAGLTFYLAFIVFPRELFKRIYWLIVVLFTGVKKGVRTIKKSGKRKYAK